ncbi:hypothetical protein [Minwuia thermotolerans]|uniref:Phytase-like domain-containing protein n=1 Tax=Minwuia thermotolerans TaxID=2056226 RepID=A0A2M9G028_9PROT|nr:hypothetical protein [Minwuia thermotolerans]PJK29081.1 hypothetical protein CVT23_14285 [Minwuia thermotolerans]
MRWLGIALALIAMPAHADVFDCRHVNVVDNETGQKLAGIEDLVHHPPSNTLILSVHDRWGDQDDDPEALMGLFGVRVSSLEASAPAEAWRLGREQPEPMRPHGIALAERPDGEYRLLVIDHRYLQEEERNGAPGTVIREFAVSTDGALSPLRSFGHPKLCPANDLDWYGGDKALVTLDRANCGGFRRFLELARGQERGRLVEVDLNKRIITERLSGLAFPNGIMLDKQFDRRQFFLTETRASRVSVFRSDIHKEIRGEQDLWLTQTAMLAGSPDNISSTPDATALVALHPDVFDFGLYSMRIWGYDSSGTRLIELHGLDPQPGIRVILDDPDGEIISGATSVIQVGRHYFAGSAFDEGLAVCEEK